jgi:hypothetical protein
LVQPWRLNLCGQGTMYHARTPSIHPFPTLPYPSQTNSQSTASPVKLSEQTWAKSLIGQGHTFSIRLRGTANRAAFCRATLLWGYQLRLTTQPSHYCTLPSTPYFHISKFKKITILPLPLNPLLVCLARERLLPILTDRQTAPFSAWAVK